MVELAALVVQRLNEQAQPLAIRARLEVRGKKSDRHRLLLRGCSARVPIGAYEKIDRCVKLVPAGERERNELRIYQLRVGGYSGAEPVAVGVELGHHVRA